MKNPLLLAAIVLFILPSAALADIITFNTTQNAGNNTAVIAGSSSNTTSSNYQGGVGQVDLDHHRAYTWQISNVVIPTGHNILSATITFNNIANWDTNHNRLFVHLLDQARTFGSTATVNGRPRSATVNGITWYEDATGAPVPDNQILDYFAGNDSALVTNTTADTYLFERGFNKVGQGASDYFSGPGTYVAQNYTYTFTASQRAALAVYIANFQNLAFGIDADCHYWNNGLTFQITTAPTATPEPATLALLGTGLMSTGFYLRRRRKVKANTEE